MNELIIVIVIYMIFLLIATLILSPIAVGLLVVVKTIQFINKRVEK